jgi:hypothetical protein
MLPMKLRWYALTAFLLTQPLIAQEPQPAPPATGLPIAAGSPADLPTPMADAWTPRGESGGGGGFLVGDKGFANFIGYISNPTKAIDPRSLTQLMPIDAYASVSAIQKTTRAIGPLAPRDLTLLPAGEINIAAPALSIAVTERLNVGITSGSPAMTSYPNRHQGWLDIGGYAQYTLIRDVPGQFIATAGMTWVAPSGSTSLFQGISPVDLGTYLTVGKEFGNFHILNTVGFQFPAGSGTVTHDIFYGTLHLDHRFGWLYPLVEFNWAAHTTHVDLDVDLLRRTFFLDDFSANGSIITVAPGFNAVLIPDKVELGAVYQTPIASENHLHFNSFLVKMVLRF